MMRSFLLLLLSGLFYLNLQAQEITYSKPQSQDVVRNLSFEIIGKMESNYLVYKNIRNKNLISVFDKDMNLVNEMDLKIIKENPLNVDFVLYPNYVWMIYQYQQRNVVYCKALKINSKGQLMADPITIDTSHISFYADNKIYSTIKSEDKSKIMVYKIQRKNGAFNFTTLLLDESLTLLKKNFILTDFDFRRNVFSDFLLSNRGDYVFTKGYRDNSRGNILSLDLITKKANDDSFQITNLNLKDHYLDEIKIKVDNVNGNYLINSFYYDSRRGNTEGMYTVVIREEDNSIVSESFANMAEIIPPNVNDDRNTKSALNDFFIRNISLKKDGGFLLTSEDYSTRSQGGSPWNRYDYLYNYRGFSPYYYNYYSPYGNGYYGNGRYGNSIRYLYSNILVMSMNNVGQIEWAKVIRKNQYDDDNDNYLSFLEMLTGNKLHFIFNAQERQKQILSDQSITASGEIERSPPLHNLDKGYEFMPRYGKQVDANEMLIPCTYRNYIAFARITF